MKSENKIKPEVYNLMWEIRKFTRSTLMLQQMIAEKAGLYVTDAECIDFLMEMGPSTAGDLSKATRLTTGAITNVIDRLERAGFVKRSPDPKDRRKVVVSYIPERKTGMDIHYASLSKAVQKHLSAYTKKDLDAFIKHTNGLTKIYQEQVKELRNYKKAL
jgi:DNA-binding MarR family transcriptional regulator